MLDLYSASAAQTAQVLLRMHYRELARRRTDLPEFADVEFRCHSQNGEDGILLYLFSLLSTTNRRVVEICAGDGIECNAANLIVNHGWRGLLFDGDREQVARGNTFYATCRTTFVSPPVFRHEWITTDNINELIVGNGFGGLIDLLSLDLDGNDYWIWDAIDCVEPRVVVLEFNAACGPERAVSMSYTPSYVLDVNKQPYRCGASLPAFTQLARRKGYRLVGVQSLGFNAFFVRDGLGEDLVPTRSIRECYDGCEPLRQWSPALLDLILSGPEPWQDV